MAECLLTGLFLCDRCETNFEEIMRLNNHMKKNICSQTDFDVSNVKIDTLISVS